MTFEENYLRLVEQIDAFVEKVTGASIIDAYFGPANIFPKRAKEPLAFGELLENIDGSIGQTKELSNELRRMAIASSLESLKAVVKWLSGEMMNYSNLVKGVFGVVPRKFGQNEISKAQQKVEDTCTNLPGSSISEKLMKWIDDSKTSGKALKKLIHTEVAELTKKIERLFETQVFTHFPTEIKNNGVKYKSVRGKPWGANNYYQGNYTSVTAINIDLPIGKPWLLGGLCHEYEHHVANLFREKYYREDSLLDLSAVLYHTKECVIDEGTADCAEDFLGLRKIGEYGELLEALKNLRSMVDVNAAHMLNIEDVDEKTVADYIAHEGFAPLDSATRLISFIKPYISDDKPNFFRPYIYTYLFGKMDYVLPTFQKAQRKGKVKEFFQTLYLNPYSRSTATWKTAFSKI